MAAASLSHCNESTPQHGTGEIVGFVYTRTCIMVRFHGDFRGLYDYIDVFRTYLRTRSIDPNREHDGES